MANRIGASSRREEQRLQLAMLDRLEAAHQRQFMREIGGTIRDMARWIADGNSIDLYPIADHRERVGVLLASTWERSATVFGQRIIDAAGKAHGKHSLQTKALPDAFLNGLLMYQRRWLAQRITQISSTTMQQTADIIKRGEADGLSIEALAKLLRARTAQYAGVRAHVIARTETHNGQGLGNQTAAEESGLDLTKEWISASDERTREDHDAADGQEVGMQEMFIVGRSELMYPGDPSAPADQTILCRCCSGYIAQ